MRNTEKINGYNEKAGSLTQRVPKLLAVIA